MAGRILQRAAASTIVGEGCGWAARSWIKQAHAQGAWQRATEPAHLPVRCVGLTHAAGNDVTPVAGVEQADEPRGLCEELALLAGVGSGSVGVADCC